MRKTGPDAWGPHAWKFLHYVSLGYSDKPTKEEKEKYKLFYLLLQDVLPCSICREHYKNNYSKIPITEDVLSSRDNLVKWVIDLHNIVNEMKGKPKVDYDTAVKLITNDFNLDDDNLEECSSEEEPSNNKNKYNNVMGLVFMLLLIVFVYSIVKKRNLFK
jgi:hypothetical protein